MTLGPPNRIDTLHIPLPQSLSHFVREQTLSRGYYTSGEYVRALIRAAQMREAASQASEAIGDDFGNGDLDRPKSPNRQVIPLPSGVVHRPRRARTV